MKMGFVRAALCAIVVLSVLAPASAAWDPANGDWSREDPTDLRVMTWNVQDSLCSSTNRKFDGFTDWNAVVRIVASMRPDVLILQETADNSGNGTGSGVDSVADLETTLELFLYGGADPFNGFNVIDSYVQAFAPDYDLPHIFVSTVTDGFNRNVIMSRYPFVDLNGDGRATLSDVSGMLAGPGGYPAGGSGEIRGFMFAEIDLPDEVYAGDLVVGNAHLKAGGSSSDFNQRETAAKNVAFYIDNIFNGAGTGTPDPNSRIFDSPQVQEILDENTPVIWGGDWNEDELTNGRKGPAEWLIRAEVVGEPDGTDRDRGDSMYDEAVDLFNGSRVTQGSSSKLDYIAWQDSITTLRRAWVYNSSSGAPGSIPPELDGFGFNPAAASGAASDHRPVIADFQIPLMMGESCPWDLDGDGAVTSSDLGALLGDWGSPYGSDALAALLGSWGPCP